MTTKVTLVALMNSFIDSFLNAADVRNVTRDGTDQAGWPCLTGSSVEACHCLAALGQAADRGSGVEVHESQTFARHAIPVRCRDDLLAVADKIAVAQIVGHDPNQIRSVSRRCQVADEHQKHGQRSAKPSVDQLSVAHSSDNS